MPAPVTMPATGSVFLDPRGGERALRVSWHTERGLVVLSLWRDNLCAASFRLDASEVPALIEVLAAGLAEIEGDRSPRPSRDDTAEGPAVAETMPIAGSGA